MLNKFYLIIISSILCFVLIFMFPVSQYQNINVHAMHSSRVYIPEDFDSARKDYLKAQNHMIKSVINTVGEEVTVYGTVDKIEFDDYSKVVTITSDSGQKVIASIDENDYTKFKKKDYVCVDGLSFKIDKYKDVLYINGADIMMQEEYQ